MGLGSYLVTGQQIVAEAVVFHLWREERKRDLAFGFVFMESKLKERKENATQTSFGVWLVELCLFGF